MAVKKASQRSATIARKTKETDIKLTLALDGSGESSIKTGVGFIDHMLTLFSKHGLFDLTIKATGDIDVDVHHLNEDLAICLGEAVKQALGAKAGIVRYGSVYVPMDEALARVVLDISNRPYVVVEGVKYKDVKREDYYFSDMAHFLQSFAFHAGITMHVDVIRGMDKHHVIEAVFKALGKALRQAVDIDKRVKGVPSTKGVL